MAALVAGLAVAPCRVMAQQSAPAATAQNSSTAANTPKEEKPETEEEASNKFRHTALVKSAAKALHLSDEAMAKTFEFINFAIIVLAIGIPLFKFLPKFLRNRGEKVRVDIESARKVTEDANARLSAVEAKLASLGDEIQRFRAEVEAESLQDEARIKAALAEESARIVAAAEQEIGVAAAQATRGLRNFAADLAIDQATRQLKLTPETDRALIAEFVGDVAKGGLN
ncbi:MAG: ATP synthase F0 subunit B [Terracidiphilus sp.]|jgi:F-type H+-transporting ATPase subunit b